MFHIYLMTVLLTSKENPFYLFKRQCSQLHCPQFTSNTILSKLNFSRQKIYVSLHFTLFTQKTFYFFKTNPFGLQKPKLEFKTWIPSYSYLYLFSTKRKYFTKLKKVQTKKQVELQSFVWSQLTSCFLTAKYDSCFLALPLLKFQSSGAYERMKAHHLNLKLLLQICPVVLIGLLIRNRSVDSLVQEQSLHRYLGWSDIQEVTWCWWE